MNKQEELKIKKLEKEIEEVEKEVTLQAREKDIIKDYKMKEGNYQIIIKVYEANDLQPKQSKLWFLEKSACDAFVEIQVNDQKVSTNVRKKTNNPIFDERFCFKFQKMTLEELDRSTISFKVYDRNTILVGGSMIGSFQLDWTNVYFKRNHQFYRGWLTLMDPFDQKQGVTGYLLVDIAVLGQNDKVTVHDSAYIKDPLTTIQDTIQTPKLQLIDYSITIDLYRAQNLIPLDAAFGNVDAYVIAKFSGNKIESSTKGSCNPQWDEQLMLGTGVPTKSKYITLQVRNRNILTKDDIIGVLQIPFTDLNQQNYKAVPKWGHLYGPPMSGTDRKPYNYATRMQLYGQQLGSHYRGRILYMIDGKKDNLVYTSKKKINFKFPFKPTPVIPLKHYTLKIDLINGFDMPQIKNAAYIHVTIGQYTICSKQFVGNQEKKKDRKKRWITFEQRIEHMKINLPEDPSQIPDLIIYYANGPKQKNRISFARIKATQILSDASNLNKKFNIYTLKGDLSLDNIDVNQNGGYIKMRAHLFSGKADNPGDLKKQIGYPSQKYALYSFVYRGKGFPPMNETGDCDAYVQISCADVSEKTSAISSYNPVWNQKKKNKISTYNITNTNMELGIICTVYDKQEKRKDRMIGNYLVKLSKVDKKKFRPKGSLREITFLYGKPKWYPVVNNKIDQGDPCVGYVLYGCALFAEKDLSAIRDQDLIIGNNSYHEKTIQIFLIGVREMKLEDEYISNEKVRLEMSVSREGRSKGNEQNIQNDVDRHESNEIYIKQGCVHFNQMKQFQVRIPTNRCLMPYIDFKIFKNNKFYAYSSISLEDMSPELMEIENQEKNQKKDQQESEQETILDVDSLEKQLDIIRQRKKLKEAKERAEKNKQHYIDTNLKELVPPMEYWAVSTTAQNQKDQQLDKLLQDALQTYNSQKIPDLDLAKSEQSKKDRESISRRSKKVEQQQLQSFWPKKTQTDKNIMKQQEDDEKNHLINKSQDKHSQREIELNNQMQYIRSEKSIRDCYQDSQNRFGYNSSKLSKGSQLKKQDSQLISDFQISQRDQIMQVPHDERAITFARIQKNIEQEQMHEKQARQKMQQYKYDAAVKLSLFDYKKKKKNNAEKQTYQDYDTDEDEDLDIIPEWYKGRQTLVNDFQELVSQKKKIKHLPLYRGGENRGNLEIRQRKQVANLRFVAIAKDPKHTKDKEADYRNLLKPKQFVCRFYILKGKSLIPNFGRKPSTYLRITYRGIVYDLKDKTYEEESYNPEYYICHQMPMEIPGPSTVKIEVMETESLKIKSVFRKPKVLGYTLIDVQQRYFMRKWHLYAHKKPIQLRNLYSEYGVGTQGRLQVWVDLIEKKNWLKNPPYKIHKPPYDPYELRVIVWSTKDCVYKNQTFQSNDIFVKGSLGTSEAQQTDTHWACRAVGNFNYRFKFKVSYPLKPQDMYSDQFRVQIWDRDMVGFDNLIGERRINLNNVHRIIEKAVKRKRTVQAKMKIREKALALTEKFWFDVYNHKAKDQFGQLESQGKVQLSFELVPEKISESQRKNGFGRSDPNQFPPLQSPSGRLSFSLLHPLSFFKQLCGPELYDSLCKKLIGCFVIILIGLLVYFLLGQVIATAIVGGGGN